MIKRVNIGREIEKKLSEKKMSITHFADLIGYSRRSVYRIFERSSIDIDLLVKISTILQTNFIEEYYVSNRIMEDNKTTNKVYIAIPIDEQILEGEKTITVVIKKDSFEMK